MAALVRLSPQLGELTNVWVAQLTVKHQKITSTLLCVLACTLLVGRDVSQGKAQRKGKQSRQPGSGKARRGRTAATHVAVGAAGGEGPDLASGGDSDEAAAAIVMAQQHLASYIHKTKMKARRGATRLRG